MDWSKASKAAAGTPRSRSILGGQGTPVDGACEPGLATPAAQGPVADRNRTPKSSTRSSDRPWRESVRRLAGSGSISLSPAARRCRSSQRQGRALAPGAPRHVYALLHGSMGRMASP